MTSLSLIVSIGVLFFATIVMPIGLVYILFNVKRSTLKKPNIENMWGKLYEDINLDSRANLVHWPFFVLRRLIYI